MRFSFAIIGGGLTGTAMLYQLVEKVGLAYDKTPANLPEIQIQIFEKQDAFGPGFPHCDRNVRPFHITNMCAKDMGIRLAYPADFQQWVSDHQHLLIEFSPSFDQGADDPDRCNHYPRAIMGTYLTEKFQEAYHRAQQLGLAVDLYSRSEVVDLERKHDKIHLTVEDLASGSTFSSAADRVLIATGHWFEKMKGTTFFPSPWPASNLLRNIPEGEKIAVIGTSLSAIEVVLTLTSDGHFIRDDADRLVFVPPAHPRRFVLYSRRGLLPKVRGRTGTYRNTFLTRENLERLMAENQGYVKLEAVFELLSRELRAAYGHRIDWQAVLNPTRSPADLLQQHLAEARNGDGPDGELIWQTVLYQSFDMVREIYLRLSLEDRKHFDQEYTSVFFTHAATQPALNAEKILALMRCGLVEVVKLGRDYQFVQDDSKGVYAFLYRNSAGNQQRDTYTYVVDARGQAKSIQTDPSLFMQNLIRRGVVQIEELQHVPPGQKRSADAANRHKSNIHVYKTGSIWIDPQTHLIMRRDSANTIRKSKAIYAVGAMTRGQIIDASMARGIVQSTAAIADGLIHYLKNRP
ncbi:MAG: FAD/NAD(P)-binding protein [Desulfobacterales bacterium]|nr:FAD/NAD(P)-binding protein [Desulfobacterales bacterium]